MLDIAPLKGLLISIQSDSINIARLQRGPIVQSRSSATPFNSWRNL
jgi:hypothetical protein